MFNHSNPARQALVASLAAAICIAALGCGGTRIHSAGPVVDSGRDMDPIATSELRERALELLTASASSPNPQLRANALEAMAITPVRVQPLLTAALKDENAGVRSTAAVVVGNSGLSQLAPDLRPLLNDSSPFVRASAIYGLVRSGADVDRSHLAVLLLEDPSPRVRAHAAFLLGELGDRSALELLKEAARVSIPRAAVAEVRLLRIQLAEAMVKLGDNGQIETIRAALYPSRPEELEGTALAVQAIGHLNDRTVIDELVYLTALRDEQGNRMPAEVRLAAAGALARLGLRRGTFIADEYAPSENPALRAQAAHIYGEIGYADNLHKLEKMMVDPVGFVQVAAAAAVVKIAAHPARAAN